MSINPQDIYTDPELLGFLKQTPEGYQKLKAQIIADGYIKEPVTLESMPDGRYRRVDGQTRQAISDETGIPLPPPVILDYLGGDDATRRWMYANQIKKQNGNGRHLSIHQGIAYRVLLGLDAEPGTESLIRAALKIREQSPQLFDDILSGKLQIGVAKFKLLKPVSRAPAPPRAPKGRIHIIIGDTQIKPGVPTQHLTWIGRYIADQFVGQNVAIIHLGDHWDMPSLSSYDAGKKASEGRRYIEDIKAGNEAFALLNAPIAKAMQAKRWKPERHFLFGNHEERVTRACNDAAFLEGKLSLDDLDTQGWRRHAFLEPLELDGIAYAHYFIAQNTGKPLGGENAETRLKNVGTSFTMGHQQGRKWAERQIANGKRQCAMILGSTYLHDEDYRGPQGNANWRGIAVCHQVEDGAYDPMFVSLDFLCRKYEGKTLADFMKTAQAA